MYLRARDATDEYNAINMKSLPYRVLDLELVCDPCVHASMTVVCRYEFQLKLAEVDRSE